MKFTIVANTYFRSAEKLTSEEIVRINDFVHRLQANPESPGFGFERVVEAIDSNMWSAHVSRDTRAILHHEGDRFTLLYVGHADDAYAWAKRRRVKPHPVTGRIQIVVMPEMAVGEVSPSADLAESEESDSRYNLDFSRYDRELLLGVGVPLEWIDHVQNIRDEVGFWKIGDSHLFPR